MLIKSTSEDPNWWLATDKDKKEGMIPANYVVRWSGLGGSALKRNESVFISLVV